MNRADMDLLFDHLYWIRDRILAAADHPSVAFTALDAPTSRNLRATLVHELDVEWSWRERLRSADRTAFPAEDVELKPDDFPTLASLRSRWARDEEEMRRWVRSLTDDELVAPCRTERRGSHPFWYHLHHVYAHGLQQFSDAAVILTAAGRSPGQLEFLQFLRDRARRPRIRTRATGEA